MRKIIVSVVLILSIFKLFSQDDILLPSPQTYSVVQYGNIPVNYFSGEINNTIPIYTYKDKDFTIPIYLGYNSSGFKPTQHEGIVGLNWYLNAGGAILRTVNGLPDDQQGKPTGIPHGFYCGVKESSGFRNLTRNEIYNISYTSTDLLKFTYNTQYELQPDKFTFSAPGLSGSFYINNDGTVICEGNSKFDVDLTNLSIQPYETWTPNPSSIIITSDNGYIYHFGGTVQHLEFNQPLSPSFSITGYNGGNEILRGTRTIIAWHLTEINAPNGRTATYHYRNFTEPQLYTASDTEHYIFNKIYSYKSLSSYRKTSMGGTITSVTSGPTTDGYSYSATKTVYLDYILIDNTKIQFNYSNKPTKFYDGTVETSTFNQFNLKLDDIKILYGSSTTPIKLFSFTYVNNGRLFLNSLTEEGNGKYTFSYYTDGYTLPSTITRGIDHWGFWNGMNNVSIVPFAYFDDNGNETYDASDLTRNPNENYSKAAMLKQIVYPTGGITKFVYEDHDYSLRLERRSDYNHLPHLYAVNGNAGGVRIKEIINYKSDGLTVLSGNKFNYQKNGTSSSSGILLEWPEYYFFSITESSNVFWANLLISGNNIWSNHFPGEKYIQYSEVKESPITDNNTYTRYKYLSYDTIPNIAEYNTFITQQTSYNGVSDNLKSYSLSYPGITFTDLSSERGKLFKIEKYGYISSIQKKIEETKYEYVGYNDNPDLYITAVQGTGYAAQSYKIRYAHSLLKKEIRTTYSTAGDTSISDSIAYSYNESGIKKAVTNYLSNGDILQTDYRYPYDISATGVYSLMIDKNMLDYPVEQISRRNRIVVGSSLTTYKLQGGTYLPDKKYLLEPITRSYSFNYYNGWEYTKDPRYNTTPEVVFNYTTNGYLSDYSKKDGIKTYLIYGYNGMYPIAKIESNNYNDGYDVSSLRSTIAAHNFTTVTSTEVSYLKSQLSTFINSTDCMVTLYTYSPLVGITSETLPNGMTTYYSYDTFGRLSEVRDDDGKLLKKNTYNYAN